MQNLLHERCRLRSQLQTYFLYLLFAEMSEMSALRYPADLRSTLRFMKKFENRLDSFLTLNLMPKFAQLAAAGFRYKVEDDFVQCAFSYLIEYNYLSTLDHFVLHAKKNPYCLYLRKKGQPVD